MKQIEKIIENSLNIKRGSQFIKGSVGSRLHLLLEDVYTQDELLRFGKEWTKEALEHLVRKGEVDTLDVKTSLDKQGLKIEIEIVSHSGQEQTYNHFVRVI